MPKIELDCKNAVAETLLIALCTHVLEARQPASGKLERRQLD
jgi:hypothetical protein